MRKISALLLLLSTLCAHAQKLFVYPKEPIAPAGTYQSVTAIVMGLNEKSVSWTSTGGRLVGASTCVLNEPCTIALYSATPGKFVLKATSNDKAALTATAAVTFTAAPMPLTSHPRLMITPALLPELRAKAAGKDRLYESMLERAEGSLQRDGSAWSWSCKGGSGKANSDQSQTYREQDAELFALLSEVAPTKQERDQWGCYGHDVFLTMAGYVISGALDVSKGNHWSDSALAFSVTPDWLMGGGYLTASDMPIVRQYLAKLAFEQINDVYNGSLALIGNYNSPAQFKPEDEWSVTGMRSMGNNYTQSRILILSAAALTLNDTPAEDPTLRNSCNASRYQVCPDGTAGSLHAYWRYVTGGLLYKDWADMEDPVVVQHAFQDAFKNMPGQPMCNTGWHKRIACLGSGRGGESNEGTSYGASLGRLRWALNAIHTAGYDDPLAYGPQMSIGSMSYWDLRYVSDFTLLTGLSGVPKDGSRWNALTQGDTLNYYVYPSNFGAEAAMLAADAVVGRKDRRPALEWISTNTAFGLANGKAGTCGSYCGINDEIGNDFADVLAFDLFLGLPKADAATLSTVAGSRPSLPTDWYDAGNQHVVVRDKGWTTDQNTIFSLYCTNTQIDHEHQFCGGFDLYSDGEYITKGRTEFNDYNDEFSVARNKNTLELIQYPGQTWCRPNPWCSFNQAAVDGGQFWHGYQAGLVNLLHAELPAYLATAADMTNAYNGGWGNYGKFNGVTGASRSLIYLREAQKVIYYDRGSTGVNAWKKATYLVTTNQPSFAGNSAAWLTRSGKQKVYWTQLEPGARPRLDAVYDDADAKNDWEIFGRIKSDAGAVRTARFLSVLQWGPATFMPPNPTLVQGSGASGYEGALVGSTLAMFMRDWPSAFGGVSFPASGAKSFYVADLKPNTAYTVSGAGTPNASVSSDHAGVLAFSGDGTGTITVKASAVIRH